MSASVSMFLLMSLCMGFAAVGLFAGAIWSYFSQKNKMESRLPATGTVVELVRTNGRSGSIFCPVVEFSVSPAGEKIRFTSDFGSRPASHKVGQSVNVRYDPADPQKAEIQSGLTMWLGAAIFAFLGAIAGCLTLFFLGIFVLGTSH